MLVPNVGQININHHLPNWPEEPESERPDFCASATSCVALIRWAERDLTCSDTVQLSAWGRRAWVECWGGILRRLMRTCRNSNSSGSVCNATLLAPGVRSHRRLWRRSPTANWQWKVPRGRVGSHRPGSRRRTGDPAPRPRLRSICGRQTCFVTVVSLHGSGQGDV